MKSPILDPELKAALKRLKLGYIFDVLPERLVLAEQQELSFQETMLMLLQDEITRRDNTASSRRAEKAKLDPSMLIERWDKTAKVRFDTRVLNELMTLRFIEADRNVVILGPVGVGKTFVANALGHVACRHKYEVAFHRADDMLRILRQSRLDNSREAVMLEFCTVDLLIIDDFAIEPMTRDESRDIYQLFIERSGRASTIVTSNRDTAEWIAMFDDVLQAQSAVDRFINAAFDLIIEGESYRARLKPKVDENNPPPASPKSKLRPSTRRRRAQARQGPR